MSESTHPDLKESNFRNSLDFTVVWLMEQAGILLAVSES